MNNFISFYLTSILGFYVYIYIYVNILGIHSKISCNNRLIILVCSFIMTYNNIFSSLYLKIPLSIIILTLFFQMLSKENVSTNLLLATYINSISLVIDFILSIILSKFIYSLEVVNSLFFIKITFSITYFWLLYFISKIPIVKIVYIKILDLFKDKKSILFIISCFLFFVSISYISYIFITTNNDFKFLFIFSVLSTIFLSIITIFYIKEAHDNQILNVKNKYLTENQEIYQTHISDFRMLKHNLFNDFLFISSLCNEQVRNLIAEKIDKYKEINFEHFNSLKNIPEGLQGIIYFKSSIAIKNNIDFIIDSDINFNYKALNKKLYIDLCEVISITLDNAIEASSKAKNKIIYFNFIENNNMINIEIYNTYNNLIDVDNLWNKNFSTKSKDRGLGLYYIKKLNKKIEISNSVISDLFKICIELKK